MANSEKKTVPVAYVTRWAATRGIVVMRGRSVSDSGRLWDGFHAHSPKDWTTDKDEAERRWRLAVTKAGMAARRKAEALLDMALGAPKYDDTKAGA